jgi:dipeptidyl aminopeptidase/acylaminoacyl peptidase
MMRAPAALVLALSCGAAAAQTAPLAPEAAIPVEHFTRFDEFGGVQISPDGKFVAMLSGEQGRSQLAFLRIATGKIEGAVRTDGYSYSKINIFRWLGPTRLVYTTLHSSPSSAEPMRGTAIYAINRDGSEHQQIHSCNSTVWLLSRTRSRDPQHIRVAEYALRNVGGIYWRNPDARVSVSTVNVFREQPWPPTEKPPLGNAQVLLDDEDRLRLVLGTDEELSPSMAWKPDPEGEWQTLGLDDFRHDALEPVRLSTSERSLHFIGVRHDEEFAALYRIDLQTRQVVKVYGFERADVTEVITDFADSKIVGVRSYTERPIEHWLLPDDPDAQTYQALHRAFPDQRVQVTSAASGGGQVIVRVDSDINPGDYYLFDTASRRASFLRAARAWIDPKRMQPKEPIKLAARDGLQLHGYVTRPAGTGPQPLVVMPHDGPWGERDTWEFDWEVQLLASRGYTVLQVNYRGSAGYGVDFERAGNRQWGRKIQDDIVDATRWAVAQGIARADRICILGKGYGGYAALMGVVRDRDLYRCAIGYAAQYDLSSDIGRREFSRTERLRMDRILGSDAAELRTLSPIGNAASIEAPVLLIHGTKDWRVDSGEAERMTRALQWRRRQVELMRLPREGPTAYDENTRREVYERILQFLDANLRTPQPTAAQRTTHSRPETP